MQEALGSIRAIVTAGGCRIKRARKLAEVVRGPRNYRWTGVYDVGKETVSIIAYSGPGAPAYPSFPTSKRLTGAAIREKATIVVADVTKDPRYLTAFGTTLSEIIVPVLDPHCGEVDVESEHADAFSGGDQQLLVCCPINNWS
jgi:putative methionine-R-sulfoxide reductase with GAF domain